MEKSIIDIIFYLAAPAFVLAAVYFLIRQFLNREYKLRLIEVKRMMVKETLPLRLHING